LSAELTKNALLQTAFLMMLPTWKPHLKRIPRVLSLSILTVSFCTLFYFIYIGRQNFSDFSVSLRDFIWTRILEWEEWRPIVYSAKVDYFTFSHASKFYLIYNRQH